jgi:CRISPR-associated protein Cas2
MLPRERPPASRVKLTELIEPESDSPRFYFLSSNWQHRVEHIGAKPTLDLRRDVLLA